MNTIKVSIIVPVYNGEKYIQDSLKSILNQTYRNIEIIIVDDGSTDRTEQLIGEFTKKDNRIKLVRQSNSGAPRARNHGLRYATGEVVTFFDADDLMREHYISHMVALYRQYNADLVICSFEWINENGCVVKKDIMTDKIVVLEREEHKRNCKIAPSVCCKLFRKSIIYDQNIRFANVRIAQDFNFSTKYKLYAKKTVVTNEILVQFRMVEKSISRSYDARILDLIKSHKNIVHFYRKRNRYNEYKKMLNTLLMYHIGEQLKKLPMMDTKEEKLYVWKRFKKYFFHEVRGIRDVYPNIYWAKAMVFFLIPPLEEFSLTYKILVFHFSL